MQHTVHQGDIRRQFELDLLTHVRQNFQIVNEAQLVGQGLLDDVAQLILVVRQAQKIGRAHLEGFDDAGLLCFVRRDDDRNHQAFAFDFAGELDAGVLVFRQV